MRNCLSFFCFLLLLVGCGEQTPDKAVGPVSASSSYVEYGRALVKGLAACGFCHSEEAQPNAILSGGRRLSDRYGEVSAPNITPARYGLEGYDLNQIVRALRDSVDRNNQILSHDLHSGFEWLSDKDAFAIAAYIKTLPPIEQSVPRRNLSFVDRNTIGLLDSQHEVRGYIPEIEPRYVLQRGEYLADHVARCQSCHNSAGGFFSGEQYLAGGKTIKIGGEERLAPNISSSEVYGIGSWSQDDIVNYLKTGRGPDGRVSDSNFCPTEFYANARNDDLVAVAQYLKSVPAAD